MRELEGKYFVEIMEGNLKAPGEYSYAKERNVEENPRVIGLCKKCDEGCEGALDGNRFRKYCENNGEGCDYIEQGGSK